MPAPDQPMPEGTDHIIAGAGVGEEDGELPQVSPAERIGEETMFTPDEKPGDDQQEDNVASGDEHQSGSNSEQAGSKPGEPGANFFFASIDGWRTEGFDRARDLAQTGIDRATGALDDVVRMINDTADQIDAKLGDQYGGQVRRVGQGIGDFGEMLKGRDVDQLFEDAREVVRKSPAVAIGAAAALGFVVARLARAGFEATQPAAKPHEPA